MSTADRTERIVRAWLAESVEPPRVPDYLPDLVALTARTSQRPAWTLPERWIPVATLTRARVALAPVPWRTIGLLTALLLALAAALLVAGSRPRVPAPFGPAANGHVAYADRGDIYTVDPRSGLPTALTSGPETVDSDPIFSRDGTQVAFRSSHRGLSGLAVVNADGTNRRVLSTPPVREGQSFQFTPDGRSLLVITRAEEGYALVTLGIDSGRAQTLLEGTEIHSASFVPPDGRRIVVDAQLANGPTGLYLVDTVGGRVSALVEPQSGSDLVLGSVSPDGTRVAYGTLGEDSTRLRLLSIADGTFVEPPLPRAFAWQTPFDWSNDGRSILVGRGYADEARGSVLAIVPTDDLSARGVEASRPVARAACCPSMEWAPDDSVILVTPVNDRRSPEPQVLVDRATGEVRPAAWTATSPPAWQRLAP